MDSKKRIELITLVDHFFDAADKKDSPEIDEDSRNEWNELFIKTWNELTTELKALVPPSVNKRFPSKTISADERIDKIEAIVQTLITDGLKTRNNPALKPKYEEQTRGERFVYPLHMKINNLIIREIRKLNPFRSGLYAKVRSAILEAEKAGVYSNVVQDPVVRSGAMVGFTVSGHETSNIVPLNNVTRLCLQELLRNWVFYNYPTAITSRRLTPTVVSATVRAAFDLTQDLVEDGNESGGIFLTSSEISDIIADICEVQNIRRPGRISDTQRYDEVLFEHIESQIDVDRLIKDAGLTVEDIRLLSMRYDSTGQKKVYREIAMELGLSTSSVGERCKTIEGKIRKFLEESFHMPERPMAPELAELSKVFSKKKANIAGQLFDMKQIMIIISKRCCTYWKNRGTEHL